MSTVWISVGSYNDDEQSALARAEAAYKANIACRDSIEAAFGSSPKPSAELLSPILEQYGYQRTAWVLANTLYERQNTEHFGRDSLRLADRLCYPHPDNDRQDFLVRLPAAMMNALVSLYKRAYRSLPLFDSSQCLPNRQRTNYQGQVLALRPDMMQFICADPKDQLWYAVSGEGCEAGQNDADLLCTNLSDGYTGLWTRRCFAGVLREELLPDWAQEKLAELTATQQENQSIGEMKLE